MSPRWSCARCGPRSRCRARGSPRKGPSSAQCFGAGLRGARPRRVTRTRSALRRAPDASGSPWPSCSCSRSSSCLWWWAACAGSAPRSRRLTARRPRRRLSRRHAGLPARRARSPAHPRQRRLLRRHQPSRRRAPRRPWRPPPRDPCAAPCQARSRVRVRVQTSLTPGGTSPWLICFCMWTAPNTPP
jgi:hypothetical protein